MAICLPGMASRVNRAPTSATRPAPLVMTTNWITSRMAKTIRPTISEPPTTKCPKVSITLPAYPSRSTSLVALTLRASRNSVITSTTAGNAAKSSGRWTNIAVSRMSSAPVMFSAISRSRTMAGSGTTSITTMNTMPTGTPSWERRFIAGETPFEGRVGGRRTDTPSLVRYIALLASRGPIGRPGAQLRVSGDVLPGARRAARPRSRGVRWLPPM